ncbi:hypothetical protein IQ215_03295 [Cyanobacterium stanieri LEGE 03274]|uniref:DUF6816 domain-containing protein n=1 Tax=Cyanobacterium stanieri LEGE 03274 TaxID=1828756 RepID=A0ABR9V1E9_9CHRO|nr:hypothetical protein [Cyanobacterium stanieri]MBE9221713.1 hypothetical protein [Cyanobacterium stanieri LEGE 03274]
MFNIIAKLLLFCCLILTSLLINTYPALAENLENRIDNYPNWNNQISLPSPEQELIYPLWFEGDWLVTNILKEQIAPFAPEFETPGFSQNSDYIDKKITFPVKFISTIINNNSDVFLPTKINTSEAIIADRSFNARAIAQAYLGENNVKQVIINQKNSTEQITKFSEENELISTVVGRKQETINQKEFITSEITRQFFRRPGNIYVNFVETTTKYNLIDANHIKAKQYTAVYLSPQDPDYFIAFNKPVALYFYELNLEKTTDRI